MKIIKEENSSFEYKEGEEIELDVGKLNSTTLWKLDAFLKAHKVNIGSESPDSRVFVNKVGFGVSQGNSDPAGRAWWSDQAVPAAEGATHA